MTFLRRAFLSAVVLVAAVSLPMASSGTAFAASLTSTQYGFSFPLPPKWTAIPLDKTDLKAILQKATQADPKLKGLLDQQVLAAAKQGIKYYAVGPAKGQFYPNLNIQVLPAAGVPTGPALTSEVSSYAKSSLDKAGATHVHTTSAHTGAGETAQVTYQIKVNRGTGEITIHGLQSYLVHGSHLFVITFTSTNAAGVTNAAHTVESSWHWTAAQAS